MESKVNSHERKSRIGSVKSVILAILMIQLGIQIPGSLGVPQAHATATNEAQLDVCNTINDSQKVNKDPNVPVPGYTDCVVAEQARIAKQQATAKAVIFGTLSVACLTLAYFGGDLVGSCAMISTGASMLGVAYDMFLKQKIDDNSKKTSEMIRMSASSLVGLFEASKHGGKAFNGLASIMPSKAPSGEGGGAPDTEDAAPTTKEPKSAEDKEKAKAICVKSSITLGINAGLAVWEGIDAKSIQKMKIQDAKNAVYTSNTTTRIENQSFGSSTGGASNSGAGATAAEAPKQKSDKSCDSAVGNAYLTCTFQGTNAAPAISALIGDNRLNNIIGRMTGGKTLGDLARGFKGEPSGSAIGNYVGSAFGFPSSVSNALAKHFEGIEKSFTKDRPVFTMANYSSKGSSHSDSKAGASGDLDFSKMMEGLLKQMNPEEASTAGAKEAPGEAVFRRLDLLPPDKIEANKDISLFVRIGYRYRKKTPSILSQEMDRPAGQR